MLEPNEMIITLTPSQIEKVSSIDDVVSYVNSLPAFKNMLEKGIGCVPDTDQLMRVWGDLQGIKVIVSKDSSNIQQGRALERFQEYMTAEKIQRVKPIQYTAANIDISEKMVLWYHQHSNIYARLWKDDQGKVDIKKSDVDGWLTEVYRAVFGRIYRIGARLETNATTKKPCKMKICGNKVNCDHLVLANGYNSGGIEKRYCSVKCRNQANSRKSMRKIRGLEKRTDASPRTIVQ